MTRTLYVDCFAGAAGDMMLGALLDLGLPVEHLQARLALLGELGGTLEVKRAFRHGIGAVDVTVRTAATPVPVFFAPVHAHSHGHGGHTHSHAHASPGLGALAPSPTAAHHEVPHRGWREIRGLIQASGLDAPEKALALRIFERLALAEGKLHGMPPDDVEFHEVGGVDAIIDIVGTAIGLVWLAPEAIVVAPIPTPRGFVRCAHGLMPLPAPATMELLVGAETRACPFEGEWVTPTGAAILTTIAHAYGPLPAMRVGAIGYGAGDRDPETHANLLRLVVGDVLAARLSDAVLETNIDDMSPELYGHLVDRLFEAGALDVWLTPIQMKKGRPGTKLSVLSPPERVADLEHLILAESTAIGVRHHTVQRHKATRSLETIETRLGPVRVKVARDGQRVVGVAPEYEDCRALALSAGVPLKEVMQLALEAARAAGHR